MAECGRRLNAGSATGYSSAAEVLPRLPGWPRTESGPERPPAEPRRGELDAANLRGSNDVAGDADDKQLAQTLIEHHLCRDSRIGTPEDDGELLLTCRQLAAARLAPEYVAAPSARNEETVSLAGVRTLCELRSSRHHSCLPTAVHNLRKDAKAEREHAEEKGVERDPGPDGDLQVALRKSGPEMTCRRVRSGMPACTLTIARATATHKENVFTPSMRFIYMNRRPGSRVTGDH